MFHKIVLGAELDHIRGKISSPGFEICFTAALCSI